MRLTCLIALATALALGSCSEEPAPARPPERPPVETHPDDPPTALRSIHEALQEADRQVPGPSDGGGRAWLEQPDGSDGSVVAGGVGRWRFVYEAGPLGVAEGGVVFLQVSPFWEWSTPQVENEELPGYTRVTTEVEGLELAAETLDRQLLAMRLEGSGLAEGQRLVVDYGAGPAGSRADPYAEAASRFWFAVDGDGDGVRRVLADSPGVRVLPGPPARLVAHLPSVARKGETVRLVLAVLDRSANAGLEVAAEVELVDPPAGLALPASVKLENEDRGRKTIEVGVLEDGLYRLDLRTTLGELTLETRSNPLYVAPGPRILWADLHGHSADSDGTGSPEDYFLYARDVAGLDVVALTDHDHWGMQFLDREPALWERNRAVAASFDDPGRFVTVIGYEYTSWIHGHRHVLQLDDGAPMFSSIDPATQTPAGLWQALRGRPALTIPHHPGGGPIAIDWSVVPDRELESVVEITSAHGCSEDFDCARLIHSPRREGMVRQALQRGYRLGLIGSGDGHDGHPGLTALGPHYPTGGLAALLSEDLTREGVLAALRERRTYATNGARILLRFALGGARMGTELAAAEANREDNLFVQVIGTGPLLSIEIVRSGQLYEAIDCEGLSEIALTTTLAELTAGEFVYLRVIQQDGGMAWSSPVFVE